MAPSKPREVFVPQYNIIHNSDRPHQQQLDLRHRYGLSWRRRLKGIELILHRLLFMKTLADPNTGNKKN